MDSAIERKLMTPGSRSPERVLITRSRRRREAHAGVDASAVAYGRETRAVAEVRQDDAPPRRRGIADAQQLLQQESVRQSMKSVALNSLRLVAARNRQQRRDARHASMERGIEARHLRQLRKFAADGLDEFDLTRQMFRVVGNDASQLIQERGRHALRARALHAVHHAMADCAHAPGTSGLLRASPSKRPLPFGDPPRRPRAAAAHPLRARHRSRSSWCHRDRFAPTFLPATWSEARPSAWKEKRILDEPALIVSTGISRVCHSGS